MTYEVLLAADGTSAAQRQAAKSAFRRAFDNALGRPNDFRAYFQAWTAHVQRVPLDNQQADLASAFLLAHAVAERQGQKELGLVVGVFDLRLSALSMTGHTFHVSD